MSAIGGIINYCRGGADVNLIKDMKNSMRLFAGDEWRADIYSGAALLFGGSEQPVEREAQPNRRASIVFDGRLADAASGEAPALRVLGAYLSGGFDALTRTEGDFSLAIYDIYRACALLYVSSDKASPIYYCKRGASLIFANALCGVASFAETGSEILKLSGKEALMVPTLRATRA